MEKITEKVLLEKGSPKTNKLEQIKMLNLSKMGLQLQDLPVKLLSRLWSLERWDLSGNRLQDFHKSLELPALRFLDLSDNQMEDVTTLESLVGLEELKMDDNLYITVSDNYKLMVLLPNLRIYNGKDVSTTANHLRYVYSDNLRTRIIAVWEKNFSLPDPITAEELVALETSFVSTARQQVKFGPSSVSDFTKWKVEIMAKEYLRSLTDLDGKEESTDAKENKGVSAPVKRKQTESETSDSIRLMPRKKLRSDLPASPVQESPRKSSLRLKPLPETSSTGAVRMSPRKRSQSPSISSRGRPRAERSSREDGAQTEQRQEGSKKQQKTSHLQKDDDMSHAVKSLKNTEPVCLKPLHVLQCHSKQDKPEDFSTQLWACAFQPLPDSSGGGESRLVATCGGDSVCVIDCETGMVMKKYKVSGEEFFSLSWSTVLMSRGGKAPAQHCSILAAGGKKGVVKLIHPRNNVAYGEFRASRKSLSVLRFNHQQGNFLFTGSYDSKIALWDIGGVDSQYNFKVVQLLLLDVSAHSSHICLPPTSPSTHLLTACEDGLHCYNTQLGNNNNTKSLKELHARSIYLWSWSRTKAQRQTEDQDMCAVVLAELQWADTEIPYLALNTCPGRLWTYTSPTSQINNSDGKPIQPTEVLEWPTPMRDGLGQLEGPSINNVAMDPELRYLAALSDKNMVVVWKRDESSLITARV
ncbi:LOW QUALITY PROTEIN: leucine-rich repeat and WD repeat-containing protein 1 [Acanthochromis polyacanthus]|uniref:LOW QUALITY PROTEIN: leucine-rich repeat and WD repeat-containing protein 1 n=1 Tax=Acanthochromis polyacanthus TaxID=80966 RepID=UPI0022345E73|nr:LOW QUALITY PROTEIN: leucine-rich repeat and WD repeat-containing protein 1 [Acanthochromis polyacanthus]